MKNALSEWKRGMLRFAADKIVLDLQIQAN
jgi:hypothetical protein